MTEPVPSAGGSSADVGGSADDSGTSPESVKRHEDLFPYVEVGSTQKGVPPVYSPLKVPRTWTDLETALRSHGQPSESCPAFVSEVVGGLQALSKRLGRRPRVLLGVTGSVAAIKTVPIVKLLRLFCQVKVVLTEAARHFVDQQKVIAECVTSGTEPSTHPSGHREISRNGASVAPATESKEQTDNTPQALHSAVFTDAQEWDSYKRRGDPVLHIELRKWADCLVISPLSANTLGKLASGLCNNLLTCVCRAWDRRKPFVVAPAMNTMMWEHPLTMQQLRRIGTFQQRTHIVMPRGTYKLMCGDVGAGAVALPEVLAMVTAHALSQAGKVIVKRGRSGESHCARPNSAKRVCTERLERF